MQAVVRWFRGSHIYDINYSDHILRSIVKTTYAKKRINSYMLILLTLLLRLHIDAILGVVLSCGNFYIDFWVQIGVSVVLVIKSGWIYQLVELFDQHVYSLTRYLVNHYTHDTYRYWKRIATLIVCGYLFFYFSFFDITSGILRMYVLQYVICYLLIELIEKNYCSGFMRIFTQQQPSFIHDDAGLKLIEDKRTNFQGVDLRRSSRSMDQVSSDEELSEDESTESTESTESEDSPLVVTSSKIGLGRASQFITTDDFVLKSEFIKGSPTHR